MLVFIFFHNATISENVNFSKFTAAQVQKGGNELT